MVLSTSMSFTNSCSLKRMGMSLTSLSSVRLTSGELNSYPIKFHVLAPAPLVDGQRWGCELVVLQHVVDTFGLGRLLNELNQSVVHGLYKGSGSRPRQSGG